MRAYIFIWAFSADGASVQILTHVVWCTWMCYLINNVMYKLHSTTAFQDSEEESFASGERGARAILSAGTHETRNPKFANGAE